MRAYDQSQTQVYCASILNSITLINFPFGDQSSFKILDEDSDEGDSLVEINNDGCKIITERTVFDHIREKANSLPSLAPKSTTEYLEYEETLNLIRKRTHERQLVLNDNTESLKLIGDSNPCEESIEPDGPTSSIILNGDTIFEHIRKKAKSFPRVDEIKSLSTKSYNINSDFDFDFDLFTDVKSNIVQKENVLIIDSDVVKPQLKPTTQEKQHMSPSFANRRLCSLESEVTDPFVGMSTGTRTKLVIPFFSRAWGVVVPYRTDSDTGIGKSVPIRSTWYSIISSYANLHNGDIVPSYILRRKVDD
nr:DExH-box ATP-dependent RNA helicase DExH17 isoform X1 [Tanacetum cinerariifolium]